MRYTALIALLLLCGCERYRLTYDSPLRDTAIIQENNILAARIRRTQVIAEIARLNMVLRRTGIVENRIALQSELDERERELDRLSEILERQ